MAFNIKSQMINTTLGMMIIDPFKMPPNLGKTGSEDYPESSFRVVAYDGQNVLPTALGYKSFFSDQTLFNVPAVPSSHVQAVIVYQAADYSTILIALAEEGAWLFDATEGSIWGGWQDFAPTGHNPADGVRHMWSWAVVANQLYLYSQGQPHYYTVCTPSYFANNNGQTIISGATVLGVLSYPNFGVLEVTPNFLNMAGQLGLFRADTRLGMWDSENSVAWSSATQTYDFEPSIENFAGVTQFADVTGAITKILGQGEGFIIYASRSIVRCVPSGSSEMWAGSALMSDNGVAFDVQVAAAQPDVIHYAYTGAGLVKITGGSIEPIDVEVSDYLAQRALVGIDVIDSRYLFLHSTDDLTPSKYAAEVQPLPDTDGNVYKFKPTYTGPAGDPNTMFIHVLDGSDSEVQFDYQEVAEPDGIPPIVQPNDKALIPCYSGRRFDTNVDETLLNKPTDSKYIYIPSAVDPLKRYEVRVEYNRPLYDNLRYGVDERFDDKAAENYVEVMQDSIDRITNTISIINEGADKFGPYTVTDYVTREYYTKNADSTPIGDSITSEPDLSSDLDWTWDELMINFEMDLKKSKCGINFTTKLGSLPYESTVIIHESVYSAFTVHELNVCSAVITSYHTTPEPDDPGQDNSFPVDAAYFFVTRIRDNVNGIIPCTPDAVTYFQTIYSNGTWEEFEFQPVAGLTKRIWNGKYVNGVTVEDRTSLSDSRVEVMAVAAAWGAPSPASLGSWNGYVMDKMAANSACGTLNYSETIGTDVRVVNSLPMVYGGGNCVQYDYYGYNDGVTCDQGHPTVGIETYWGIGANQGFGFATVSESDPRVSEYLNKCEKRISMGTIFITMNWESVDGTDPLPVFESDISGFGYQPSGGFSFRKTHSRSSSSPCTSAPSTVFTNIDPREQNYKDHVSPNLDTTLVQIAPTPPGKWTYPPAITLPNFYALFKKGTPSPFYPVWKAAAVYDINLQKWGRYSNEHSVVYGLLPTNRVDDTIVPVADQGMRAGAFKASNRSLSFFTETTDNAMISYGKLGRFRQGLTTGTKAIATFSKPSTGHLIIELSRDGKNVDLENSLAVPFTEATNIEINFTETAKWFNIRLEGQFDLDYLDFESAATARR